MIIEHLTKTIGTMFFLLMFIVAMMLSSCTPPNYQLTVSSTPSNGGTISPSSGIYKSGTQVSLIATPSKYYKFDGWAGDVIGNDNRLTLKMNSNKTVVASFKKITYNLQFNVNTPGSGTIDPNSGNYDAGNQIKITATPASGYRFDRWGGSASGNENPISILVDTDKTLTAYFTKLSTLKVSVNPNDGGSVNQGNGVYDSGKKVELTATQIFPYAFNNWSGTDNDIVNPTTVTMNTDKSVICNFVKLVPGEWKEEKGIVFRGGTTSVPLELNQYEYIEGEIVQSSFSIYIQDPTGATIKNFGYVQQSNFLITAQVPGRYNIVLQKDGNSAGVQGDFIIKYRIYRR
jgi:hypothetical protein